MATKTREPLDYYLALSYPFSASADAEGGYVITFPDLPGCMTQVEDPAEIGPAAEEARRLWIMTEYEDGENIPLPSYPEEYSGKFNLRLPRSLHRRLAELAEREGVSLNQLVVALLAERSSRASRISEAVLRSRPPRHVRR
jgi:predicted RNase H-like HicB family nuclease